MDFWDAMEASRKVAFKDMVGMTIFYVTLTAIYISGVLSFFVGALLTIPFIDMGEVMRAIEAGRDALSAEELMGIYAGLAQFFIAGFFSLMIGLLIAVPYAFIVVFVAYEKLVGFASLGRSSPPGAGVVRGSGGDSGIPPAM